VVGGGDVGGVRPYERALKQRTRRTGVFSGFTGVSHFTCDLRWAAGAEKLTVNVHVTKTAPARRRHSVGGGGGAPISYDRWRRHQQNVGGGPTT